MNRTLALTAFAAGLAATTLGGVAAVGAATSTDQVVRADGPSHVHADGFGETTASVQAVSSADGRTLVTLNVRDLPEAVRGDTLGAHVHIGACASDPFASKGHYTHAAAPVGTPLEQREIWLDIDVNAAGAGRAATWSDWHLAPGAARSVVLHADPTDPVTGVAGARLLCIDVPFGVAD